MKYTKLLFITNKCTIMEGFVSKDRARAVVYEDIVLETCKDIKYFCLILTFGDYRRALKKHISSFLCQRAQWQFFRKGKKCVILFRKMSACLLILMIS